LPDACAIAVSADVGGINAGEEALTKRNFMTLLGGTAAWPLVAHAQQPAMPVIGFLNNATFSGQAERIAAFRQGLEESGFVVGKTLTIEYRSADGQTDRLPALAADLVHQQVSVLAANSTASALAAKAATSTLPIAFVTGGDPVELGLVATLNQPGGNATGIAFLVNKLVAKRLELLNELVPGPGLIGMLVDPNNPNAPGDIKDAQEATAALGRQLLILKVAAESELEPAFANPAQRRVTALFVAANVAFFGWRDRLIELAATNAIATSYAAREFVAAGGLMTYAPNEAKIFSQLGRYTGVLLKGAKPADLPVQQPVKFELMVNLKTAKALRLSVPDKLLALTDEVIE
jgi:putative ABC transport system substrate-binding protein